jgi:hypothetical protein
MKNLFDIYDTSLVEESILDDIENTMASGNDIAIIADFVENTLSNSSDESVQEYINSSNDVLDRIIQFVLNNNIISCNKGELVLDYEVFRKIPRTKDLDIRDFLTILYQGIFSFNLFIEPKKLHKAIKVLTLKNVPNIDIATITMIGDNNLSTLDINCEGGKLNIVHGNSNKPIKLGKIVCSELFICGTTKTNNIYPLGLSFKSGTVIDKLYLKSINCSKITKIEGKDLNIGCLCISSRVIKGIFANMGFASANTDIELIN